MKFKMAKRQTHGKLISVFVVFAALFLLRQGYVAWAEDDFQYWSGYEISKELSPQFEIFYNPEFRLRDDASDFFYHEHRQGIRFKPSKYLAVGLHYLFARNQGRRGQPLWEHRGELDVTPKFDWGHFNFSVRGRAELRQIQRSSGEEEWRFRIKPQVTYKARLRGYQFKPYVSDDLFYDVERDAWNQNRLYLGVSLPLGKLKGIQPSMDFYYMLQSLRSIRDDWNSNHIFGTKFSIRL